MEWYLKIGKWYLKTGKMISKVKFGKMPKLIMNYKISIEENGL